MRKAPPWVARRLLVCLWSAQAAFLAQFAVWWQSTPPPDAVFLAEKPGRDAGAQGVHPRPGPRGGEPAGGVGVRVGHRGQRDGQVDVAAHPVAVARAAGHDGCPPGQMLPSDCVENGGVSPSLP